MTQYNSKTQLLDEKAFVISENFEASSKKYKWYLTGECW